MIRIITARGLLVATVLAAACKKDGNGKDSSDAVSQAGAAKDTNPEAPQPQLALPVVVEDARDGDLVITIQGTGLVRSEAQAVLKFEIGGTIDRVLVRPGQYVRKGQMLATLDTVPFALALAKAEAEVRRAQLSYDDLLVDSVISGRTPTAQRKASALTRSGLEAAKLSLDQARLDRKRSVLVAPYDGTIDRVDATEGERISGEPVVTIVDLSHLRIEASVLQDNIPYVRSGGFARVTSAAMPGQVARGQIVTVLPLVDSVNRAGRAYVRLNGNGVLRPGMSVDVQLEANRLPNRRLVPFRAVIERDGRPLVFVIRNGRAYWQYITPGKTNGFETEVLPDSTTGEIPVKAGEQVIVQGHHTLTHDALVKVVRKEETKK